MTKEGITPEGARNEEVPEMRRSKGLNALLASLATFVLCLGMGLLGAVPARAHEAVDVSRTGSITVFMVYEGEPVGGGSLTLYRVGEVAESDGNFSYALSDGFAGAGLALDDIEVAGLAQDFAAYAQANGIEGAAYAVGDDGVMSAAGLELGLYLVTQERTADGFEEVSPFLVSVPAHDAEADAYVYDVDATPKMEPLSASPEPEPEPEPEPTPEPGTEPGLDLPETGEDFGPMIAVFGAGLVACAIGLGLRARKRDAE